MSKDKDYLSQEEIDALLKGSENESSAALAMDMMTELELDTLGEIGNISLGSSATALSTLLGQKVEITAPKVGFVDRVDLAMMFPKPHVAVQVKYLEGLQGLNMLIIKANDAQVIADLMMGGNGQPNDEDLTEMHISAVQEAMNQMMGSAATSMSTVFKRLVNIGPPEISILDFESIQSDIPFEEPLIKVSFHLKIGNLVDSDVVQILPVSFGRHLVAMLMDQKEESKPARPKPSHSIEKPAQNRQELPPQHQENRQPKYSEDERQHQPAPPQRNVKVEPVQFSAFHQNTAPAVDATNLNLLLDIPLKVTVELGRTSKQIREILELSHGSIIELDKLAGEPVDILVNNKLIAKGEVVVIEENFGVRVTDIISQWDRVKKLQ